MKQSHAIDNLHVMIASPFVPQVRNDELPFFGSGLNQRFNVLFTLSISEGVFF